MKKFRCISLATLQDTPPPSACVLGLGNFDGVHLGHRALLSRVITLRDRRFPSAACGTFCFSELSSDVLSKNPPAHLCTIEKKLQIFRSLGLEYVFLVDFSAIRNTSPAEFAELLKGECFCVAAVCGFNYRFGKNGVGTPDMLKTLLDLPVEVQEDVHWNGKSVSSTRIRELLRQGETEHATAMMLHPYEITSPVLHGKALGRTWGVPTINQDFPEKALIPANGVYLTECHVDERKLYGITNVGVHPTVDQNAKINCETHLLDFSGELYGEVVRTAFLKRIRPEITFRSEDELKKQILADIQTARDLLKK